jgi:hypothetical protein
MPNFPLATFGDDLHFQQGIRSGFSFNETPKNKERYI